MARKVERTKKGVSRKKNLIHTVKKNSEYVSILRLALLFKRSPQRYTEEGRNKETRRV
jgi:hypothetical protein